MEGFLSLYDGGDVGSDVDGDDDDDDDRDGMLPGVRNDGHDDEDDGCPSLPSLSYLVSM